MQTQDFDKNELFQDRDFLNFANFNNSSLIYRILRNFNRKTISIRSGIRIALGLTLTKNIWLSFRANNYIIAQLHVGELS